MNEVTQILNDIDRGDARAAADLLPLVYEELRKLARGRMSNERPEHTLQATALVHEAYLRLVGDQQSWANRAHFFAAAAEAMRRILIEHARRRTALRRGQDKTHVAIDNELPIAAPAADEELISVHEALEKLAVHDPEKAELVKLKYFAGLTTVQAAAILGISEPTAKRHWAYARAWLFRHIERARADEV